MDSKTVSTMVSTSAPQVMLMRGVEPLRVDILDIDSNTVVYEVSGTPICQYDQHSRARIGATFSGYEVSDYPYYILYTNVYDSLAQNQDRCDRLLSTLARLEVIRNGAETKEAYNLMSRECSYIVEQTRKSMFGQMMRRLKFCEEEFIVGLHWLLKEKLSTAAEALDFTGWKSDIDKYFPACDHMKKCDYSSADYLSNMFGCLFAGCGRWPMETEFATFNQSCTTYDILESQLNIDIPRSEHDVAG